MDRREHVRYSIGLLPEALNRVVCSWKDDVDFEVTLVDYSKKGIRVSIRSSQNQIDLPAEGEGIRIRAPFNQRWIAGQCVHVRCDSSGSLSIGIFFNNEEDQEWFEEQFFNVLNENREPVQIVSSQWEEVVGRLCDSSNPELRDIGLRYRQELAAKKKGPSVFGES